MMEAEKQVDSFSEDYDKIKNGTPERWINFKYYSPLLAFYIMEETERILMAGIKHGMQGKVHA